MNKILIGNIICFFGSVLMTLAGLIKQKRNFLKAQSLMNVFYMAGNLFLGGISGAIANLITFARNMVCLKFNINTLIKISIISVQVAISLFFGVNGLIMWFPILGVAIFTWFIDTENMVVLKIVVIITQALFGIYDFYIKNFATFPFDIFTCITNTIALVQLVKAGNLSQIEKKKL